MPPSIHARQPAVHRERERVAATQRLFDASPPPGMDTIDTAKLAGWMDDVERVLRAEAVGGDHGRDEEPAPAPAPAPLGALAAFSREAELERHAARRMAQELEVKEHKDRVRRQQEVQYHRSRKQAQLDADARGDAGGSRGHSPLGRSRSREEERLMSAESGSRGNIQGTLGQLRTLRERNQARLLEGR